ncbi:hypothetical protein H2200_002163 [Cladophialophora chaetospira]|uniref:C2H2 type master regulator of conidiophore development brlA n=1 Tax=Cladophialophora chaetospira TaxID=386627 RepID=A0AA38XID5_9EURO|nr:hypothetical protein H2200_002163 [Cladophialophora chaetospira]
MSHLPDPDSFDFDRDILGRSPPLEPVKPNYETQETPPPLVRLSPSSDSEDGEDTNGAQSSGKRSKRSRQTKPSFADGVLIRSLDPNEGELANFAERNPLESASQSEAEEEDNEAEAEEAGRRQMSRSSEVIQSQATQVAAKPKEEPVREVSVISHDPDSKDDWPMIDTPATVAEENSPPSPPIVSDATRRSSHHEKSEASVLIKPDHPPKKQLDTLPPPRDQGLGLNIKRSREYEEDDEDSLSKSPALAKFAIARNDAPADFILPALQQKSPPRSSPAGSPEQKQNLPNIKTAIGDLQDTGFASFTGMSPMNRSTPGHLSHYASPASYSALSPRGPMGPPSNYDYWRAATGNSNASTSSSHTSSSATTSTPASSIAGPSPVASNPSPMAAVPEHDRESSRRDSFEDNEENDHSESHSDPPPNDGSESARFASGNYKCTYHACTAAPFQTQYLLNSHMNVHSNSRTHFCPVKNCPRGPGGQGFKRKNEMIRHGLVHTSPGYICPFCPDQQHKYPRPDNLQRHVRQHHTDKDRDDPVLRDVLNQRMEGGSRGGRRRVRL